MLAIAEFEKRFREILESLDALVEASGDEDLEELNAEFEDALFLLHEIDFKSEDATEEFEDALEEFEALAADYARFGAAEEIAGRLDMLVQMARGNL